MQEFKRLYFFKNDDFILIKKDVINGVFKELIKEVNLPVNTFLLKKKELLKQQFDEKDIITVILDSNIKKNK